MDDTTFDDLVRKKLKGYEDPTLDSSALESFHGRLDQIDSGRWYTRNVGKLALVSGLLLFTGFNALILSKNYFVNQTQALVHEQTLSTKNKTIDSLNAVVERLQCSAQEQNQRLVATPAVVSPQFKLHLIKTSEPTAFTSVDLVYKVGIGRRENIPQDLYEQLNEEGLIAMENGEAVLLLSRKTTTAPSGSFHTRLSNLLLPTPTVGTLRLVAMTPEKSSKTKTPTLRQSESSLQARNMLEKHYFKGIGLQIGPHLDLVKSVFTIGTGEITPRLGVTADWIVSPHLSLETGVDYSTTNTHFNRDEVPFAPLGPQLGTLTSETISNRMISLPLSLKYRYWIFDKSQLIVRGGYTPYGILTRQMQYDFVHHDNYNPDGDGDKISTLEKRNEYKFLGGALTSSVGLMIKREKNKGQWEASLFYERSMGQGFENNPMQLFGLRTAYWFKVK
jgi:hypothetical protein